MPENKNSYIKPIDCSPEQLLLKAYNIKIVVDELGIISNEIQAIGSILESLGAAITAHGNFIGAKGFELETMATRLHIESIMNELQENRKKSKSNLYLQLEAYNILLVANTMGISSNNMQALGAAIQTAAGIIVAYGNMLAITAFELENTSTSLQIASILQQLKNKQNMIKYGDQFKDDELSEFHLLYSSQQSQLEKLHLKMNQIQESVNKQQDQIKEIQKALYKIKRDS